MTFGFIGSGKMASALAQGAISSGALSATEVVVTDRYPAAAEALAQQCGARTLPTNEAVAQASEVLVLCVKPGDALAALRELQPQLAGRLVISIVAGLNLASLQDAAGTACRLIRVMPNTPALVFAGATGYALGTGATEADAALVEKLFGAVGIIFRVAEPLLDAVTGLSGSGPAYGFTIIEALSDAGVLMGLPRPTALKLAAQTVAGAAKMVLETSEHPAVLREAVTSPGGTTAAGLEALEEGGLRASLLAAVRAATERAQELGRQA